MRFDQLKRREFIWALGGALAWPLTARAQQLAPVIGYLSGRFPAEAQYLVTAFEEGLRIPLLLHDPAGSGASR